MNLKFSLAKCSASLAENYESLRSKALACHLVDTRGNNGMALFLYRGMSTWVEAWSKCHQSDDKIKRTVGNDTIVNLPAGIQRELVVQLANMGLAANGG